MADAFATTEDLEARWRPLSTAEKATAAVLLGDASAMIRAECPDIDARLVAVPPATVPELDPTVPRMVVCAVVKRAMLASAASDGAPVTAVQQTAGPFSQSLTMANPTGDLYLTRAEKRVLGCGAQTATTIPTPIAGSTAHLPWCSLMLGAAYCSCGVDIAGRPIFEGGVA